MKVSNISVLCLICENVVACQRFLKESLKSLNYDNIECYYKNASWGDLEEFRNSHKSPHVIEHCFTRSSFSQIDSLINDENLSVDFLFVGSPEWTSNFYYEYNDYLSKPVRDALLAYLPVKLKRLNLDSETVIGCKGSKESEENKLTDFNTLVFNPMSRVNEVSRYSSVYQETNESLAEHITEVSMMSYLIAKNLNLEGEDINEGLVLEKCLLHDIDEVLTGDIPRNTKYATVEVHNELNKVAEEVVKLIEDTIGVKGLFEVWNTAKEGKEGLILKIVDMLCVAKKSITEIELRGNLSFLKVVTELESHLSKIIESNIIEKNLTTKSGVKYLESLVSQAKDEITTIRVKHQHVIDKYRIKENVIKGE